LGPLILKNITCVLVFSFQWNLIILEFTPEWAGMEFHWNPFIYLSWITNNVCLAIMLTKHGHSLLPTTTISSSHHHQPCLSMLPTMLITTTALRDHP